MSINVTVTGNPISIKRGKLVTNDSDDCKREFDKRRRIRLEQVRQQSKEIAEDVRNRVRKVKHKQLSDIEQQGKEKLKEWQARKLLELQNQYKECLNDLGLAHKEADLIEQFDDASKLKTKKDSNKATVRGKEALERVRNENTEKQLKKVLRSEQKKFVRDIENTRSALVSDLAKSKKSPLKRKKKKPKANVNVTVESKREDESDVPELINISSGDSSSSSSNVKRKKRRTQDTLSSSSSSSSSSEEEECTQTSASVTNCTTKDYYQDTKMNCDSNSDSTPDGPPDVEKAKFGYPFNTKISDRIKNRPTLSTCPDICKDYVEDQVKERKVIRSKPTITSTISNNNDESKIRSGINLAECAKSCYEEYTKTHSHKEPSVTVSLKSKGKESVSKNSQEIPTKPTVGLKSVKGTSKTSSKSSRPKYYDHSNCFTKNYTGDVQVERINDDSIEVIPSSRSEVEFQETVYKRDREAEKRGQKALEKERIRKDYKELMKKLPVLQKKERIAKISSDKPVYHMSDDRLKEYERKKQNKIDNAYERLFPPMKPPVITIPSKKHHKTSSMPFETVDANDPRVSNLATWDTDKYVGKSIFNQAIREGLSEINTEEPCDENICKMKRREKLQCILKNLIHQRNKVLEELKSLPEGSNLNGIIEDLSAVEESDHRPKSTYPSTSDGKYSKKQSSGSSGSVSDEKQNKKQSSEYTSTSSSSGQQKDRIMTATQPRLILQNTSTQTSPKPTPKDLQDTIDKGVVTSPLPSSPKTPFVTEDDVQKKKTKKVSHSTNTSPKRASRSSSEAPPCKCHDLSRKANSDELCEIVIKIRENDKEPEIIVSPSKRKEPTVMSPKKAKGPPTVEKIKTKKDSPKKKIQMKVVATDKPRSWRDQFNQNSVNTTSSTSYMSPPDFKKTINSYANQQNLSNILFRQPQQTNISNSSDTDEQIQNFDPCLIRYIRKLLKMSRGSVDNLTVSTISETSTPSGSIIEMSSNDPLGQLRNIMKHYNIDMSDIEKFMQYSSDETQHCNTTESVTLTSSGGSVTIQKSKSTESSSSLKEACQMTLNEYPEIIDKYTDIAATCNKRISNLNAMIEQVRMETQKIMNSATESGSDKENSTRYLNIPNMQQNVEDSPNSSFLEQQELNKKLLEVDFDLARKLKTFPPFTVSNNISDIDKELLGRFKRLLDVELPTKIDAQTQIRTEEKTPIETTSDVPFVPLLLDIPKLPKLTVPSVQPIHRRPPPSKGLTVAKRFNDNITTAPHELSTIVEGDSQISNKLHRTGSQDEIKSCTNERDWAVIKVPGPSSPRPSTSPLKKSKNKQSSDIDAPDIVSELIIRAKTPKDIVIKKADNQQSESSSEKSNGSDNIEAMLRSMGMGWAVATIRKTQEALALTSSSSSLELSSQREEVRSDLSTSGDITLKRILEHKILKRINSGSSTDIHSSLLKEFNDLSAIEGSSKCLDKNQHRTSTPIMGSKSTNKSKISTQTNVFTEESDISSVKSSSGKHS